MEYKSNSLEDTISFAQQLAKEAKRGDIICLSGSLGAGKTSFAKGFAKGLGVLEHVNSPTFTLMQIYDKGRIPLYHFDLYRLMDMAQEFDFFDSLDDIGFCEYMDGDGVCLIEWAEYAKEVIPSTAKWIDIDGDSEGSEFKRTIRIR